MCQRGDWHTPAEWYVFGFVRSPSRLRLPCTTVVNPFRPAATQVAPLPAFDVDGFDDEYDDDDGDDGFAAVEAQCALAWGQGAEVGTLEPDEGGVCTGQLDAASLPCVLKRAGIDHSESSPKRARCTVTDGV